MQAGGEDMVKPVSGNDMDVILGDETAVGDDTDPPDPEPCLQVLQHAGQGGHIGGVTGEHVMGDRGYRHRCTTGRSTTWGRSERWARE